MRGEDTVAGMKHVVNRSRYYLPMLRNSLHLRLWLVNLISGMLPDFFSGVVRGRLYRVAGLNIGRGANIMGNVKLISMLPNFYDKLAIGRDTVISTDVTINIDDTVTIGEKVCISPFVLIYTGGHKLGPSDQRMGPVISNPVVIEDGAWVRLGAVILPGVRVGRGAVVGAGAVVYEDVPADAYVQGNPARVVRDLSSRA